jgi:hypothetical protein
MPRLLAIIFRNHEALGERIISLIEIEKGISLNSFVVF